MYLSVPVAACMLHNSGCNVHCNTLQLYYAWHYADYAAEVAYMGIPLHSSTKSHAVLGLHCVCMSTPALIMFTIPAAAEGVWCLLMMQASMFQVP